MRHMAAMPGMQDSQIGLILGRLPDVTLFTKTAGKLHGPLSFAFRTFALVYGQVGARIFTNRMDDNVAALRGDA